MGRVTECRVNGMNAAKSWNINGVDESLQEVAMRMAQSRGMTLGEWLNEMIRRETGESASLPAEFAAVLAQQTDPPADDRHDMDAIVRRLDELGAQLRALTLREQETAAGRLEAPAPQALAQIIERIEENERQAARALEEINARLDELARRLQEGTPAEDIAARQGELETALHNVLRHLEQYEKRTTDTFEQLRERLEQVAAQAARAVALAEDAHAEEGSNEEIRQLEEKLAALTRRLGEIREEAEARARAYVDESVGNLARRVEAVHETSRALPGKVEALVTEVTGQRLAQVESQIEGMVGSLREKLETIAGSVIDVDRIGSRIEELDRKLAEVSETAARRAEVEAIRGALEKLSAVVDEKADRKDVEAIVQRLDEMAGTLAEARRELAADPAFAALEARVTELEGHLREAMEKSVGPDFVQQLTKDIDALKERLQLAEEQLSYLPQLENSVARLFQSIEATNEETRRIVEETARQIMAEGVPGLAAHGGEMAAEAGMSGEDCSEEIDALRKGLEAVRQAAEEADTRTQETLAAVHETLERIVARLTEIEEEQKTLANRTGEMAEKLIDYTTTAAAAAAAVGTAGQAAAAVPQGETGAMSAQMPPGSGTVASPETEAAQAATPGMSEMPDGTAGPAAAGQNGHRGPEPHIDPSDILAAINAVEGQPAPQTAGPAAGEAMTAPGFVGMTGMGASHHATPSPGTGSPEAAGFAESPVEASPGAGPAIAPSDAAGSGTDAASMNMHMEAPDDFIAAARRAAMAASGMNPVSPDPEKSAAAMEEKAESGAMDSLLDRFRRGRTESGQPRTDGTPAAGETAPDRERLEEEGSSSVFGRFFGRGNKENGSGSTQAAPPAEEPAEKGLARRPLLVAGASLLMAVLAWTYMQTMNRSADMATAAETARPAVVDEAGNTAKTASKGKTGAVRDRKAGSGKRAGKERRSDVITEGRSLAAQALASGAGVATVARAPLGNGRSVPASDSVTNGKPPVADMMHTASLSAPAAQAGKAPARTGSPAATSPGKESLPETLGTRALREAALQGDGKAAYIVGMHYLTGEGVQKSPARAATWLARAAARGIVPAQYRLGTLYERGLGLKKDLAKARMWYEKAAAAGNVKAMHNLAVVLAGAERNYAEAAKWFRKAAEHGLRDSQYNLAVLYERGLGVRKDLAEAYYWYGLAARQKDADAAQRQSVLAARLPAEEVKALKKRIAAFAPGKPVVEANFVAIDNPAWRKDAAAAASSSLAAGSGQGLVQQAAASAGTARSKADASGRGAEIIHDATRIRRLQELLARIGYDPGPADGKMGPRTANAIRLFQLQMGLKVNGQPTREVLALLERRAGAAAGGTPGA